MTRDARILVVEDEPLIAMELVEELREHGYEDVALAKSVAEADGAFDRSAPDFAVLDMQLIGETTFEFARRLETEGVPFVFVSGNDVSLLPNDLKQADLLRKPVEMDELFQTISVGIAPRGQLQP